MKYALKKTDRRAALRIVAIYALVAALWIYFSDIALGVFIRDQGVLIRISVFKGFLFICVTGALLYHLIAQYLRESRQIEENLQVSQNLINALIEGTTDAIYMKDRAGRYLLFNTGAAQFTGKTVPETIGNDDTLLFPPADAQAIMAGDRQVMEARRVMTYEERLTVADGSQRIFQATKGPIFDAQGQVSGIFGIARDITAYKQAEEALQQARQEQERHLSQLETILDHLTEGLVIADLEGNLFLWNPTAVAMHGFTSPEEGRRKLPEFADIFELATPEEGILPVEKWPLARILQGERLQGWEVEVRRRGTDWRRIFSYGGTLARDKDSQPLLAVVSITDITERKQVEEALREHEQRLQAIISTLPAPLYLKDIEGRHVLANPTLGALLKRTPEQIIGKTDFDLFPEETARMFRENDLYVLSTRKRFSVEEKIFLEGEWRAYMSHKFPLLDEAGKVQFVGGISLDITEAKRAEEALRQNEALLRTIISSVPNGIVFVVDPELHYLVAEGRLTEKLGIAREAMEGHTLREVFAEEVAGLLEAQYRTALAGETASFELEYQGLVLWAHYAPLFDDAGKVVAALSMMQDITALKQAEEAVHKLNQDLEEHNSKLAAANRELESFIYSLSHDLRQSIRIIAVFNKSLLDGYAGLLDEQGRDYLRRIMLNTARMNRLVDDLLLLFQVARQELEKSHVDLSALARAIVSQLQPADSGRTVEVAIAEGVTAFADPRLLELILANLLGNAWKFTAKTAAARIEFGTVAREGKRVYYVKDNGVGFNPQDAEKMFLPFQQLHGEEEFTGTGLGLAIVERAVLRHGGRVWAEGETGKGATVFFTLDR